MKKIDAVLTLHYTQDLTVLYVEDDLLLQEDTKSLFDVLFKKVVAASDGVEALQIYQNEDFDIVITDIKMPNMDGVELTSKIKKIDSNQAVIVISAYNEVDNLLNFINLNINQYLKKPIEKESMLKTLYDVSKNIVNEKLVEEYRNELEVSNISMKEKDDEIQTLVRILDFKITQIGNSNSNKIQNIDFNKFLFSDEELSELQELEIDISGASALIGFSKNLKLLNIKVLGEMFSSYSNILSSNSQCSELANSINSLGGKLDNTPQSFIDSMKEISIPLQSLIYVLKIWRKNMLEKESKKAFELHSSMINDINTIISIIEPFNERQFK